MRLSSWMVSPLLIELACKLVSQRQIMPLIEQQRRILARRGSSCATCCGRPLAAGLHARLAAAARSPGAVRSSRRRPTPFDVGVARGNTSPPGQFAAPQGASGLSQPATDARVAEGWSDSLGCCAPRRPPIPCYSHRPRPLRSLACLPSVLPCCISTPAAGRPPSLPINSCGSPERDWRGSATRLEEELAAMNGFTTNRRP